jgi:BCD family chlorophyll transporter-like MFS transporter
VNGWVAIVRLGLVQMALGGLIVITTSTLNRLMVVEMALPAVLPGALVALHYGLQIARPGWGHRSDTGGRRTPFIVFGMATLALGTFLAALGVTLFADGFALPLVLSVVAYILIGLGVGASGTSLLALLAHETPPQRRAAAATITWLMMIAGIAVTAGTLGHFLADYTAPRLLQLVAGYAAGFVILTALAVAGIERSTAAPHDAATPFREGLRQVWDEPDARRFTIFIFLSMTAYFLQELILEPFAGLTFALPAGATTQLSGAQNGGVFAGMLLVGILATGLKIGSLRSWIVVGCLGSATALIALSALPDLGQAFLTPVVVTLGLFNGVFAVAAIGAMMALANQGRAGREGTKIGLWGAAQALAAGFGGLAGAAGADALRLILPAPRAFGAVFLIEAALFLIAAALALRVVASRAPTLQPGE